MTAQHSDWIGKQETVTGRISTDTAAMLHATLSETGLAPQDGDIAPLLWHWTAFAPKVPMSQLAADGHQHRGGFLPPVPQPRRMWAGGELTFHAPLHIEEPLRQVSTIRAVETKSNGMVLVAVGHEVFGTDDRHCLSEVHNIIYLDIPPAYTPPKPQAVPENPVFAYEEPMPITRLFRYSAATFNAHRIHYDLSYAQDHEHYPGLLVHGPLQATLMLNAAVKHSGRADHQMTYRGVHPMFHDEPLLVMGYDETDQGMSLCTAKPGLHQGMQARVTWKP
jgi:3-methylfumaryl-CoA hydratase